MGGEERAQRLGQEFGQRIGVGQHAHLSGHAAGIGAEVFAQPLGLFEDDAGVLQQGPAGLGRRDALPAAHQQRRAERLLHVADAGAGGRQRQIGALRAVGDAAGIDDVAKQAQISEVKSHGSSFAIWRRQTTKKHIAGQASPGMFAPDEVITCRIKPIATGRTETDGRQDPRRAAAALAASADLSADPDHGDVDRASHHRRRRSISA